MKEKVISNRIVNIYGGLFGFATLVIFITCFFLVVPVTPKEASLSINLWGLILAIIFGIICHEAIHAIVFVRYAKEGFKSIKFGVLWKALAPYCHCIEYIPVKNYRLVLLMPAVVLGAIPIIISYVIGNFTVLIWGSIMFGGGVGDFFVFWMLRKFDKNDMVLDHPDKIGFYYYESVIEDSDMK